MSVAPQCWSLGGRSSCGTVEREGVRNLHEVGLGDKVAFVDDIGVDVECAVDAVQQDRPPWNFTSTFSKPKGIGFRHSSFFICPMNF